MAVEWLPIWDGIKYHQIKAEIVYIIYCTEDVTYVSKLSNCTQILYYYQADKIKWCADGLKYTYQLYIILREIRR